LVQMSLTMSDGTHLSTWVGRETKERFAAVARYQGMSESALLKRLVELMLQTANATDMTRTVFADAKTARTTRLMVRLHPDDQVLLRERATARGMPAATYVSVLTRAHLRSLSPLPKNELLALKRTVSELGSIGRNLNQIARAANQGERVTGPGRDDLRAILRVCEGLRDNVKELLSANLRSWAQGYAEPRA
jgi:predicted DNA binding CopG/RHH family protein